MDEQIANLKKAFRKNSLSLYLGAGVSAGNGLPTWEKLVLSMYYAATSEQSLGGWRPFSNYLYAIAEWHLDRNHEPLEITARKLRKYYSEKADGQDEFLKSIRETLYGGFLYPDGSRQDVYADALRYGNQTLDAVATLCEKSSPGAKGVKSVITYNYDNLLEIALKNYPLQSFFNASPFDPAKLPIYHVHGLVPLDDSPGSKSEEIVFTEDQYHLSARDSYSWANLVQIQAMSGSVGLMVGLSLSDRNMRRLLDAITNAPIDSENYALLQKKTFEPPPPEELEQIHENAKKYFDKFEKSGFKSDTIMLDNVFTLKPGRKSEEPTLNFDALGIKGPRYMYEIIKILEQVERLDQELQEYVLDQLGITPIWYEDHGEIPGIIKQIYETG